MKRTAALLIVFNLAYAVIVAQQPIEISLNNNWQFRKAGDTAWLPATVPGCVHTDLLANALIPDPFYADNEKDVQWIENEDWEYRTTFTLRKKIVNQKYIEIDFEGLDTYADVYLNDSLILRADNMFIEWNADVKKYIHNGENTLCIKFTSAVKKGKELMDSYPVQLPGGERVFTRKAQYQYGWDWGPRLVTSGIWKDVKIVANNYDPVLLNSFELYPIYGANNGCILRLQYNEGYYKSVNGVLKIVDLNNNTVLYKNKIHLGFTDPVLPDIIYDMHYDNAKLWWCNGMGDPNLYKFNISIEVHGRLIFSAIKTLGFRNIELINKNDSLNSGFYFKINDLPVFAKGANVIPLHSFPSLLKTEDYRKLLIEAKTMNMNMIRVWGGGVYENDAFYDLCDSLGLMVWQDFMFAGSVYPQFESGIIESEINNEAEELKDHPSIALLCGNNEIDEGWQNWGWQRQYNYTPADSMLLWNEYKTLFDTIIFHTVKFAYMEREYGHYLSAILNTPLPFTDNIIPNYHPSSPTHGWGKKESLIEGDCHYWGVWWGHEPFETYNARIPRFMSEYGFQGMPSYNSFKQFIPQNELKGTAQEILNNASVKNHQKHPTGYETINEYMERDYKVPVDFEDYIYVSQLLQARGMQIAIEAHKRNMPYCMGTLFWQLNDCWPVTSWSVIDYYGNRKAAYYTVKEKYKNIMLSVIREDDLIKLFIVNDNPYPLDITLKSGLIKTDSQVFGTGPSPINIPASSAKLAATYSADKLNEAIDSAHSILYNAVSIGDSLIAEDFYNMSKPGNMQFVAPHIEISFDSTANDLLIISDYYAEKVYLYSVDTELKLSDNFFCLLPGQQKRIHIINFKAEMIPEIKMKTLNNINLQY